LVLSVPDEGYNSNPTIIVVRMHTNKPIKPDRISKPFATFKFVLLFIFLAQIIPFRVVLL